MIQVEICYIRARMSEARQTRNREKISNNYVEYVRVEQEDSGRDSSEPVIPPRSDVTSEPSNVSGQGCKLYYTSISKTSQCTHENIQHTQ